ncbi:MAG TPA: hormogonium polysaccharide biosynthesis glycosyltransferase HpsE [Trichocoleus sp.]
MDLTIAICTYNGADRLPRVLDCLRSQINTQAFSWEVLVIDNNSSDATVLVVQQQQATWSLPWPLRYEFEPRQGLAFARRRAVQHSQSPLIGFLDDDNWPAPDWVAQVLTFGAAHAQAGAYGSQILPHYEELPPPGFERIASCLALADRGSMAYRYAPEHWRFPAGAGLAVRRQAWLEAVPAEPLLEGVCGRALSTKGEDVETLSYLNQAGWEIWHNPAMQIEHHVPRQRLQPDYLLRLFRGIGLGRYPTRKIRFRSWQWPLVVPLFFLSDLRKLLWHLGQHPTSRDVVVACERTLLLYSLLSPWRYWLLRQPGEVVSPAISAGPAAVEQLELTPSGGPSSASNLAS